jgi:undecaprenyl pyrophosphate synthase
MGDAPNGVIGQIILGNSDLAKMKVLNMPQIQGTYPGAYSIQNIVSAWRENGKNYMVVYNYTPDGYNPRSDAFELCEFVILSDTAIIYTTLDHVPYKAWPDPNTPYYEL